MRQELDRGRSDPQTVGVRLWRSTCVNSICIHANPSSDCSINVSRERYNYLCVVSCSKQKAFNCVPLLSGTVSRKYAAQERCLLCRLDTEVWSRYRSERL